MHQPAKDTAISLLERAEGIRRGTVRLFHAGLMPAEQRTARGEAPSRVNDIGEDRRIGRLPELRRAVEFARELPGMIARGTYGTGSGTALIAGRASSCRRLILW